MQLGWKISKKYFDRIGLNSICIIVMTLNPGHLWQAWMRAVNNQELSFSVVVVDSGSTDGTDFRDMPSHWKLIKVDEHDFNHGATRNIALEQVPSGISKVVFLTQDALVVNKNSVQLLVAALDDPSVACSWGRQYPHLDATLSAIHARKFNYPSQSRIVSFSDRIHLGIKTCFLSNSFAAYRLSELLAIGGFPEDVILGEDMVAGARMLINGKKIAYVSEAGVYHSHNYSLIEEFRRYFDIGVLHARNKWLINVFGKTGQEGWNFLKSEINHFLLLRPLFLPIVIIRTLSKFLGYKLGLIEFYIPVFVKRSLSMHKKYWLSKN